MDFFYIISVILQAIIGFLGIYMAVRPHIIEKYNKGIIRAFGIFYIIVSGIAIWQGIESKGIEDENTNTIREFNTQITTLLNANKISATSNDIDSLRKDILLGFDRVVSAIRGDTTTKQIIESPPEIPVVENTRLIQKPTISDNPQYPYGLQVIIQSNITLQPIEFGLECSGEIGDFNFFIAGQGAYMNVRKKIEDNILAFGFNFPPLSPENSLVVTILSKTQIRVTKFFKVNY